MTGDGPATDLSRLPQVDAVLRHPDAAAAVAEHGRAHLTTAIRTVLDGIRERALTTETELPGPADVVTLAVAELARRRSGRLRPVLNATGVVLHTNLGRAPLSPGAVDAVVAAAGYTTLEYDLEGGGRGSRTRHVGALAAEVCGTEAATVVNNGAAGLLLALAALAGDRDVVVSRGELIEIGGSYRLPDLVPASGARLCEVGTTNRTRIEDYRAAVSERTGVLLKVHPSNYRIEGFAEATSLAELAGLAREAGVPLVHDLGSGLLHDRGGPLGAEPSVEAAVRDGADLVVFSGDKLLGGPQAGIVAGRAALVGRCRRHPLARAVRIDKLQRAAIEATLEAHLAESASGLPVWAMIDADPDDLRSRAERIAAAVGGGAVPEQTAGVLGGGTTPGTVLPSWCVALASPSSADLARRLRQGEPPVIVRIEDDRVLLDVRTVPPEHDDDLARLVRAALA